MSIAFLSKHLKDHADRIKFFLETDFTQASASERQVLAREVRNKSAVAAAGIAPIPLPFADIWTITPVQIAMVKAIGNVYGYKLDKKTLKAILGVVGGGWLGQQVCLALFKIGMPGAGGFAGAAFVYVWTQGIGHAAEMYFASGMKASKEDLKQALARGADDTANSTPSYCPPQ